MNRSLDSILIKPAGPDCNLACRYCFYLDKAEVFSSQKVHRMSEATLELMVQQMMAQKLSQVSFNWQGGEPTLMGLSFFQKAVELQQKYGKGQQVSNSLQTNGLLINEEWCAFLRSFNFLVGLSLDGPEHVHDYYRQSLSGQGSHSRVLESYRMMRERGVEVNALSVLTDYSVNHINEIYQSHKELGLNFMQFIPCLETKDGEIQDYSLSPEAYGEALCKLFDLWINDFEEGMPTTSIRFLIQSFITM